MGPFNRVISLCFKSLIRTSFTELVNILQCYLEILYFVQLLVCAIPFLPFQTRVANSSLTKRYMRCFVCWIGELNCLLRDYMP